MIAAGAITVVAVFAFLVNVPFGWWREGQRKFSPRWFVAVHAAVPLIVAARFALGLPFHWPLVPLYAAAYFAGQFAGARFRRARAR